MSDQAERRLYLIFLQGSAPQQLASTQDLLKSYLDQLKERAKKGDWWNPITFADDEDGRIVCAYPAYGILGVVQGGIAPAGGST